MPPKNSATEMIYKIIDNMTGIGINYDTKTNTITYTEPTVNALTSVYKPVKLAMEGSLPVAEEKTVNPFEVRSILSNRKKNAFSVVWMDGTTTVVHCQAGDDWDDEKALAMCFTKKALGNKGNFNDKFNDALDNKMKVIPEEKKVIPAREVCDCDGTCTECKCEKITDHLADTMKEVQESASKATTSFTEMVKTLANETNKNKKSKEYRIFICSALTGEKKRHLATCHSIQEVRDFVKEYSKEASYGWYFRTWNTTGGMYIDYGSYTNYLLVEGMDNSEYVKK